MSALSRSLEDIKKHYGIKETGNTMVVYGDTTSVRFDSEDYEYIITITPIKRYKNEDNDIR